MSRSPEYYRYIRSSQWREISRQTLKRYPRCCLFPWLKAKHSHHLHYQNFQNEKPIRDLASLSKFGHQVIHHPLLWKSKARDFVNFWLRVMMILQGMFGCFSK